LVAGFFCYGLFDDALGAFGAHLLWLALALSGYFLWRCGPRFTLAVNAVVFALLVQPAAIISVLLFQSRPIPQVKFPPATVAESAMPDIYHFLLDAYVRPDVDG